MRRVLGFFLRTRTDRFLHSAVWAQFAFLCAVGTFGGLRPELNQWVWRPALGVGMVVSLWVMRLAWRFRP